MAAALAELARAEPRLLGALTEEALARLAGTGSGKAWNEALARLVLRSKVWGVRRKAEVLGSYAAERSEAVLASFGLEPELAARCGLPCEAGQTWLDAIRELQRLGVGEGPALLWKRVEAHPMVQYVPAQCRDCGHTIPDAYPAPEDPNLSEEQPTDEERPFVRSGWFRGPRGPVVFVYRCPACGATSRWFRAVQPEITLNPKRWGRLCGEQEDLKAWLAKYLGVRLRLCCPLDWDHVWTEVFDGNAWRPLDSNCVDFARRLHEGIGAWTRVLALGTPLSGGAAQAATEDVTEAYLARAGPTPEELAAWRTMIAAARADASGRCTQSRTLCGYVLAQAGFDDAHVTAELRLAQEDFDRGGEWWDLPA